MSSRDPVIRAHQEWLGFLQPSGLVVSPPVLAAAGAQVNRNIAPEQMKLKGVVAQLPDGARAITDFPSFVQDVLGWSPTDLAGAPGGPELPRSLDVALSDYGEVLSPTYAVPDTGSPTGWLLLIVHLPVGADLDSPSASHGIGWNASAQARLERLLRENDIAIGLLSNGTHLRLVYAPKGESTGFITFPVAAMCEVAGRPIVAALHMLLSAERLFSLPSKQRLPALLRDSRRFQNDVSTKLAEQVLGALYELVRGFQAANESAHGALLREVLRDDPNQVYGGLLATLLRLVFVLYSEDRDLLPGDAVWVQNYSVTGLFESLRADASRYPDTVDQRFGAWARLLTLFRMLHDGARHASLRLPPRHGHLFDPDTYPFLEGRNARSEHEEEHLISPPRVSDGVVHRVLTKLLLLDGERISYRALDVEQIGSVYEAMMGFEIRVAEAPSLALRPKHVVVDLESLLAAPAAERARRLKDEAACEVSGSALEALRSARTSEDLVAALAKRISPLTPGVLPKGSLYLQPTEERRRSGSHYTPRSLTQPIVKTTLEPILANLGQKPRPEQILDLKVCDPAMGSGAFLVEACRFLGDALVEAWNHYGGAPTLPPGEDVFLHARRLVAQRCLYGVDKNRFAVDLAKLSLWLATLAKDHPFTFLDHALRHGDSLVGLSREQIASFHWAPEKEKNLPLIRELLVKALKEAEEKRAAIHALGDSDDADAKARLLAEAEQAVAKVRLVGDAIVAAFFGAAKEKEREKLRLGYAALTHDLLVGNSDGKDLARIAFDLRNGEKPVPAFHWEIEFPEVFSRQNPGFDAFVGNPPFLGGFRVSNILGMAYFQYLTRTYDGAGHLCDLVAYFFRRAFTGLRRGGTFGLIATSAIARGDTRQGGLAWICRAGGTIYDARKRLPWPGAAVSVLVSVVHVQKVAEVSRKTLDGQPVEHISSYLFPRNLQRRTQEASWSKRSVLEVISPHAAFAFVDVSWLHSYLMNLFVISEYGGFAVLQSRSHEIWARFFGSRAIELLRYTPSDCFENFPFPAGWEGTPALEAAGKEYYEFRAALMVEINEGLTTTYNRFHDPDERDPEILRLRELHAAMDRAVLDAYGWTDIQPTCEFLLDYEEEDDADAAPSRRRKPWRYRWPDEIRDEVLGRLLALNKQRAEEEQRVSVTTAGKRHAPAARPKKARSPGAANADLFPKAGAR